MRYAHILSRLFNTPLAISQAKLDVITSKVTLPLLLGNKPEKLTSAATENVNKVENFSSAKSNPNVAIIKVFDSLVSKNGTGDSGSTSYEDISSAINLAIQDKVSTLVFYIDSPGGEVAGLFGLANTINSLPKKFGIKTIAVTDGSATSAAYVIAAACQQVFATSSSMLGSIGVIMTLINVAKADEAAGIEYKILRSKDEKALINPHEPFATKAIEDAVKMLGILDTIMNDTVANFRPSLSTSKIINLNGNVVLGEEALKLNLIDGIVDSLDSVTGNLFVNTKGVNMTHEETLMENVKLSSEIATLKSTATLELAKAKKEEQERILGILDAAKTFDMNVDTAIKRIKAGSSIEDSVEMFESIKEAIQLNNPSPVILGALPTINKTIVESTTSTPSNPFEAILKGNEALKSLAN